jgi:tetratricopeptide (TPR) repeat protein
MIAFFLLLALFTPLADPPAAEAALTRNQFDDAARLALSQLKLTPRNAHWHVLLAQARIGQNNAPAALDELDAALAIDPRDADALYFTNRLTAVLATQELTRLYRIAPDSGRVHQLRAESLHMQEDSAGEEREYVAALERMPNSLPVLIALGDLVRYHARYEEAAGFYSRAEKIEPRSFDALYGLGACRMFLEDFKGSAAYLERALQVEPGSAAARLALGDALIRDQQNERAVGVLAKLVESAPTAKQGWALYGKALRQAGRKAEADAAFAQYRNLLRTEAEAAP